MFRILLFDLDGTLTDSSEGITKCVQYALKKQGILEPELKKLEPFIGPSLTESFQKYYGFGKEQALQGVADYRERFVPKGMFENKVYPGIPELLAHAKQAGMYLAVASSKPEPYVIRIMEHFSMAQYFDVITGSNLDGSRIQKEEVVAETLLRLRALTALDHDMTVTSDTCAMIGDREFDIYGAKRFGLRAVGVSYGFAQPGELESAGADYIAESVKALEAYLLEGTEMTEETHG